MVLLYRYLAKQNWLENQLIKTLLKLLSTIDAVSVSTITAANKEAKQVLDLSSTAGGKNPTLTSDPSAGNVHDHFTPKEKAQIPKRAAEHGVTNTARYGLHCVARKLTCSSSRMLISEH